MAANLPAGIMPKLEAAEVIRQARYAQYVWRRKVGAAVFAALAPVTGWVDYHLLFVWFANSKDDDSAFGLTALVAGGIWHWVTSPKRAYAKAFKTSILPDIAALFGLRYKIDGSLQMQEMKSSGIVPAYDRCTSEDYFEGEHKGAKLRFAEMELKQRRRSGKRTRYVTVFKGIGAIIDMPKNKFYGYTILVADGVSFGEWLREKTSKLQRANMVDPVFEGKYSVFTNDQTEARYLIDPAAINKLAMLGETHGTDKGLSIAYLNHRIFLMLPSSRTFFEPDIEIPATDPDALSGLQAEMTGLLGLIDHLEFYQPQQIAAATA